MNFCLERKISLDYEKTTSMINRMFENQNKLEKEVGDIKEMLKEVIKNEKQDSQRKLR
jgi:hypothetical protein